MNLGNLNMQVITASFSTADATIKLQQSNNGTDWDDITDSQLTLASGSASQSLVVTYLASSFIRAVFSKGTNAAGTFQVILSFK